jgi:hypothetical protein
LQFHVDGTRADPTVASIINAMALPITSARRRTSTANRDLLPAWAV